MSLLKDKLTLVIGSSGRLGHTICHSLAKEGAMLVVADSNSEAADRIVNTLPGEKHISVTLHITDNQSISSVLKTIQQHYNRPPSILVNIINIVEECLVPETTVECFQELLHNHIVGVLAIIKAVTSALIVDSHPGSIVNVISKPEIDCNPSRIFFMTCKTALDTLTQCLNKEIERHNIQCVNIDRIYFLA